MLISHVKDCLVCGTQLEYLDGEEILSCNICKKQHRTNIWCPEGHHICRVCYHKSFKNFLEDTSKASQSRNPFDLAASMMAHRNLSSNTCEHAWVLIAAILTAIKNEGSIRLSDINISDALDSIKEQANTNIEGQTGVCGIALAVDILFHSIFKAAGSESHQHSATMQVVAQAIECLTGDEGCKCCKNILWTTLDLIVSLIHARFGIELEGSADDIICHQLNTDEHCIPTACQYSSLHSN